MSDRTPIEWTEASWNPVTGCTKVSPGCDHCYAESLAERFRGIPGHHFERGFDLQLRPEKLTLPMRWKRPRRIFVNSMSDLFHDNVPDEYIAKVFAVMAATPQHTYQVLTKRHARMRSLLSSDRFASLLAFAVLREWGRPFWDSDWPLRNVWLGVSVENQQWADIRIPALLDTPAAVRFLSCEPLLGPVSLTKWTDTPPVCGCGAAPDGAPGWTGGCSPECMTPEPSGIDWVIVGGESGHGARPMHPDWARSLRDQCGAAGTPFLFKQWGVWSPVRPANWRDYREDRSRGFLPDGTVYDQQRPEMYNDPDLARMWRVGKKAAGRELDGRTHDEYPQFVAAPGGAR